MAKFTLEINLGNAAMETPEHVGAALLRLGDRLSGYEGWCVDHALERQSDERWTQIRDTNGNIVGSFRFEGEAPRYFVVLDEDFAAETTYPVDTDAQRAFARAAMREGGIDVLPIYTGEAPDTIKTDSVLRASGHAAPRR